MQPELHNKVAVDSHGKPVLLFSVLAQEDTISTVQAALK
jgi:hypothetical protein